MSLDLALVVTAALAILFLLPLLKIRDNVYAASLLIPSSIAVAVAGFLIGFYFLALIVLLIYIGVVITLIIVAASAIEQTHPVMRRLRAMPLLLLPVTTIPLVVPRFEGVSITQAQSVDTAQVVKMWFPVVLILPILLSTIVLASVNLSRRGLAP